MSSSIHRSPSRVLRLGAIVAGMVLLLTMATSAGAARPTGEQSSRKLVPAGTTKVNRGAGTATGEPLIDTSLEFRRRPKFRSPTNAQISNNQSTTTQPSANVPRPPGSAVIAGSALTAWDGINHFDQRTAGTGIYTNSQFTLEPPDSNMCVGNGFVLEAVNTAIQVRTTAGTALTPVVPVNDFYNLAPEIIRSNPLVFGEFTTDPKCYYDAEVQRWFVTFLVLSVDPATGNFSGEAFVYLAVSPSANPSNLNNWNIYIIDTTNDGTDGTPRHSNCPCFGDQPLIGADDHGFYITTNEFPLFAPGFNGAMVYAMSKDILAAGGSPTVVSIFQPTLEEGQAYSLQPATSPPGGDFETANGGTAYFLSALEFTGRVDNRIAVWAMTNTASLADAEPDVAMQHDIVISQRYAAPPNATQRDGSTPLLELLGSHLAPQVLGVPKTTEHLTLIAGNDDRMNQTYFADGKLWSGLNTAVKTRNGRTRVGIAWFIVAPGWSGNDLEGELVNGGYISVNRNNVMYPAVAVNADGEGAIAYTLVGPHFFPSAAYSRIDEGGVGPVEVIAPGAGPADGFTGYRSLASNGGVERWGDYSTAFADENGDIWLTTEYIAQSCGFAEFLNTGFTCGNERTIFANWSNFVWEINP